MDLHTLERLGQQRQSELLREAAELHQARRLDRASPLRHRLASWLRVWAEHLDYQRVIVPPEQHC
jgi:hypothetical protein